ncbi:MAG: histidinol-phosphatase HisJ family protein [Chitinispirillaceae bacterium]|jgi:histidinol-phosphatase (PHP family)|nr:histidinol-phosphatase HisJ family protein [Chitinispirillaceae bacterium]
MLADYHVHTPYCGHAKGTIIDYVRAAIDAGMNEIGFSDHLGRYYLTQTQKRRYWDWGMDARNLARYVAELLEIRDVFEGRIRISIGLEVDYIEGVEELLEPIIGTYPLDFLLCSVHCLPQLGWRHIAEYSSMPDTAMIYKEYFRTARAALRCGMFSSLAHLDFIWRHVAWPVTNPGLPLAEIAETIRTAAKTSHVVEINANGFLWSLKEQVADCDPFDVLLDQIRRYKVPVSIGSDAHKPTEVAKAFPAIIAALQSKGIRSFTCFADGKPRKELLG